MSFVGFVLELNPPLITVLNFHMNKTLLLGFFLYICALTNVVAQIGPASPAAPALYKNMIVETVYPLKVQQYSPNKKLVLLADQAKASYSHPEETLQAHFSAMAELNFEWFLTTWDSQSANQITKKNRELNRDSSYWTGLWKKMLAGRDVELTHWVNYGRYVLIAYRIKAMNATEKEFSDTVALTKEGNYWKLTQELANDPILTYWNAPSGRVQRAANTLVKK